MGFDLTTIKNTTRMASQSASTASGAIANDFINPYINKIPTTEDIINYINTNFITADANSGADGLVFSLDQNYNISMKSESTDHYIEDGSISQDHSINKPIYLTLTAFMTEETYKLQTLSQGAELINKQLGILQNYMPNFVDGVAQQFNDIYSKTMQITNYLDSAVKNIKSFANFLDDYIIADSKQQAMYKKICTYRDKKQLFKKITIPIGNEENSIVLENMIIESIDWDIGVAETGNTLSKVIVVFKQLSFTSTITKTVKPPITKGKTEKQIGIKKITEIVQPKQTETLSSDLYKRFNIK